MAPSREKALVRAFVGVRGVCVPVAVACRLAINAAYNAQDLCEPPIRIYFRPSVRDSRLGAPLGSPQSSP